MRPGCCKRSAYACGSSALMHAGRLCRDMCCAPECPGRRGYALLARRCRLAAVLGERIQTLELSKQSPYSQILVPVIPVCQHPPFQLHAAAAHVRRYRLQGGCTLQASSMMLGGAACSLDAASGSASCQLPSGRLPGKCVKPGRHLHTSR